MRSSTWFLSVSLVITPIALVSRSRAFSAAMSSAGSTASAGGTGGGASSCGCGALLSEHGRMELQRDDEDCRRGLGTPERQSGQDSQACGCRDRAQAAAV